MTWEVIIVREIFRTIHVGCGTRGASHLQTLAGLEMWRPVALVDVVERYFDDAIQSYDFPRDRCYKTLTEAIADVVSKIDLIVNTTSLGMSPHVEGTPWPGELPFPAEAIAYILGVLPVDNQYRIRGYDHGPRSAAPCLGQHTFEVLTELLGMDPDTVAEIAASGALT